MRDQTAEVQAASAVLCICESLLDNIVLVQLSLLDRLINADNILPHNTTSTNVQVSNLRVSHEAFWKTDGQRGGLKLSEAVCGLVELVHNWSVGIGDSIAILWRRLRWNSPSVDHNYSAKVP